MRLKQQIFLRVTMLLTLMIVAIAVLYSIYTMQRHREMTKSLWLTRSQILVDDIRQLDLRDDRVRLRQLLLSERQESEVFLYAFVLKDGVSYVHTFDQGVPAALLEGRPPADKQKIWEYRDRDGTVIYDIVTNIDQEGTTLRLGLKRGAIDAKMQPLVVAIGLISLLTILISSYFALLLARRTTREVDTLVKAISDYGELHEDGPLTDASTTEVTELIRTFKTLTAGRRKAEDELSRLNAQLEQRVSERTARLEASNKELDAFAYSVSHDLRAPLRGVEGFSHLLLEDYGDRLDDTGKEYLGRIRQGCVRMGKLIDDMLKLSRIARSELQRKIVRLGEIAGQIIADLRRLEPERKVDVVIDEKLIADADGTLIRTVLENLLGNAWKFTRKTASATIEFGSETVAGETVYFVRDNGAGFNMEYEKRLFNPFQRLHRADEFEGDGVGLASAQRIISLHGGRIWAEGEKGRGASFYFTLGGAML